MFMSLDGCSNAIHVEVVSTSYRFPLFVQLVDDGVTVFHKNVLGKSSLEALEGFGADVLARAVATGRLVEYCLRSNHSVLISAAPPSPRELLVGGNEDVRAGSRSQVTDDARFDVDASSHGFRTPGSA